MANGESSMKKAKVKFPNAIARMRKFQAFIGMTYKIKQSGDTISRKFGGSSMVRCHLFYMWAVCQIAPAKYGYKINTSIGRKK